MPERSGVWSSLTRIAAKAALYERETYFREGLSAAAEAFGDRFHDMMRQCALLMIKPDGLRAGKGPAIVEFLGENDFAVTAVEKLALGRFEWRELWRYQLNAATEDRLAVNDLVLRNEALLLLLRDRTGGPIPATVRLSGLKGPSDVAAQSDRCLRRLLAQPNRVFSYFHVADEPADLLRELALLLDVPQRRRVLAALARGELAQLDRQCLDQALAQSMRSARDLNPLPALARAMRAADSVLQPDATPACAARERLREDFGAMRAGRPVAWRRFVRAIDEIGLKLDPWDLATLGATYIVYDEPGHPKQIVGVDPTMWEAGP